MTSTPTRYLSKLFIAEFENQFRHLHSRGYSGEYIAVRLKLSRSQVRRLARVLGCDWTDVGIATRCRYGRGPHALVTTAIDIRKGRRSACVECRREARHRATESRRQAKSRDRAPNRLRDPNFMEIERARLTNLILEKALQLEAETRHWVADGVRDELQKLQRSMNQLRYADD